VERFRVLKGRTELGPFTRDELAEELGAGRLDGTEMIEANREWLRLDLWLDRQVESSPPAELGPNAEPVAVTSAPAVAAGGTAAGSVPLIPLLIGGGMVLAVVVVVGLFLPRGGGGPTVGNETPVAAANGSAGANPSASSSESSASNVPAKAASTPPAAKVQAAVESFPAPAGYTLWLGLEVETGGAVVGPVPLGTGILIDRGRVLTAGDAHKALLREQLKTEAKGLKARRVAWDGRGAIEITAVRTPPGWSENGVDQPIDLAVMTLKSAPPGDPWKAPATDVPPQIGRTLLVSTFASPAGNADPIKVRTANLEISLDGAERFKDNRLLYTVKSLDQAPSILSRGAVAVTPDHRPAGVLVPGPTAGSWRVVPFSQAVLDFLRGG
jgi:hypothetical protein